MFSAKSRQQQRQQTRVEEREADNRLLSIADLPVTAAASHPFVTVQDVQVSPRYGARVCKSIPGPPVYM